MKTTRKIFVAATLLVLGGLFSYAPVKAAPQPNQAQSTYSGLSWEQAMNILEQAWPYFYNQTGITFAELQGRYVDGVCTIKVVSEGYEVNGGGGLGTVIVQGLD